jgi:hypothetical protein
LGRYKPYPSKLAKLAERAERYCFVAQTLARPRHLIIRRAAGE